MPKLTEEQLFNLLLGLLETTTPYKHEDLIKRFLPPGGFTDEIGNYWYQVGEKKESNSLFCCHLDTVGYSPEKTEPFFYDGCIYAMSNKSSCLGGDDRCGILCLVAMIYAHIPGMYVFHIGEEKGTIGADWAIKHFDFSHYKRGIEFDRRGTTSVITVMMSMLRTCSPEFANALCSQLNLGSLEYKPDDTGLFTDVCAYQEDIAEVTNISVGYFHEHSNNEKINSDWLIKKLIPALYNVKWEELPAVRDPKANNTIEVSHYYGNFDYGHGSFCGKRGGSSNGNVRISDNHDEKSGRDSKFISNWNKEHGFDDEDVEATDGLTVFDAQEFADSCNFCGDRDDTIKEYFFDNKNWTLCDHCKNFIEYEGELLQIQKEKEDSIVVKPNETSSTTEPDAVIEIEDEDIDITTIDNEWYNELPVPLL